LDPQEWYKLNLTALLKTKARISLTHSPVLAYKKQLTPNIQQIGRAVHTRTARRHEESFEGCLPRDHILSMGKIG